MIPPVALTQIPPDTGSPGYVVAAVVAAAVLVLLYLVIVAFRVRDSARRLEALETRLDAAAAAREDRAPSAESPATVPSGVGDPSAVAAAAEAFGAKR